MNELNQGQVHYQDDEITLKELILKVKEYGREFLRNWLVIGLIALPVVGYFLYKHFTTPAEYPASLTFMVNEDEGNSVSSIGSILGQFGFGGGGGRSRYNLDKILYLSTTREIIGEAIFDSCRIGGKGDYIANHIIRLYELQERWAKSDSTLENFTFAHGRVEDFGLTENKAFKSVVGQIVGNKEKGIEGILSNNYAEETGIMKLEASSLDEELTFHLLNRLYTHLSDYYVAKTTEKQEVTLGVMTAKRDSILGALQAAEYELANFKESTRNVLDSRLKLRETRLQREVLVGTQAYAEAVKNVEISDFALKNTTPFIQAIDEPILPIRPDESSLLMSLIKGGLIGGFLGILFVFFRKVYRDAMAD